jgi:DNA-binding transcriptional ArsR family regulator
MTTTELAATPPTTSDLLRALAHPLRVRILQRLDGCVASPRELADEFDQPVGRVAYHVRSLVGVGLLRLVGHTTRRGAIQHYYALSDAFRDEDGEDGDAVGLSGLARRNLEALMQEHERKGRGAGHALAILEGLRPDA